jgi:hypothetical protein
VIDDSISDESNHAFDTMADYYDRAARELQQYGDRTRWAGESQSLLERERVQFVRQLGPGGPWGESDLKHGLAASFTHLVFGARYLTGMSLLLRGREVLCVPPLTRSLLELSARVAWLLDPRIGIRNRAARAFLNKVDYATRAKATAKSLSHPDLVRFGHDLRRLRKVDLGSRFYPSEVENVDGRLTIRGESLPGFRQSLELMEAVYGVQWNAAGMYDYLSNSAHPTLHTALGNSRIVDDVDSGYLRLNVDSEDALNVLTLARNGVITFTYMWELVAIYMGVDRQDVLDLRIQVPDVHGANSSP